MAKITIEELYRGEKYDIMSAVTAKALQLGIDKGDLVLVKKTDTANDGDVVVALTEDGNTLKRLFRENGKPRLHAENKTYTGRMLNFYPRELTIQGIALKVIKDIHWQEAEMYRPYIVCHMVTSIDGKVTGEFLNRPECETATEIYYEMNREYKAQGSGGFICGRVTMEGSFTGGWYPDLSEYKPVARECGHYMNCWFDDVAYANYFAIAFDPKGKLGWKSNIIEDSDPGYGGAMIIEVLTEQADPRYLAYLEEKEISYFFAGETEIDVPLALKILNDHLSPEFYVLEGGSIINGHFLRADCVDEISLVQAPITADKVSKSLFMDGDVFDFELTKAEQKNGALVMRYVRPREE